MTRAEWEQLCDGCGRCCLLKFSDPNCVTGMCSKYRTRAQHFDDCVSLTPETVREGWLPDTCAYRLVDAGKLLPWWHHLVSGDRETVHLAGMSVRGRKVRSESEFSDPADIELRERKWPKLGIPSRLTKGGK
jgi:uncharacterized cysteine cluster protein YcgN (CxxCxxCC family)